jgi:hypothetical protein
MIRYVIGGLAMLSWMVFLPLPVGAETPVIRPVEAVDHFQHPSGGDFYAESWNFQFLTNSQDMIYLAFVASRVGILSGSAGIDFTWAMSDGDEISLNDERELSDLVEDRAAGLITIGPHSMKTQGQSTRMVVSSRRLKADISIRSWVPGFKIKDGKLDVNPKKGHFHFFFVEIPRGDFQGTLTIDGKEQEVMGSVYMDHSFTNVPATAFSSRWYSLRAFYPEHTVALTEFQYLPETGHSRWALGYVADSRGVIGVSTQYTLVPSGSFNNDDGCAIPQTYTVHMDAGDVELSGTYENQTLYCRKPILGDLNWVIRKMVTTFTGDPVVYRFRSGTSFVLKTPEAEIPLVGPALSAAIVLRE